MKETLLFLIMLMTRTSSPASECENYSPEKKVKMNYPPLAALARIEGEVSFKCTVGKDGSVISAEVLSSPSSKPPSEVLLKAAKKNISHWRFVRKDEGKSECDNVIMIYKFQLKGIAKRNRSPRTTFAFEPPNRVVITAEATCANHLPCDEDEEKSFRPGVPLP
ncbi:MAG: energy transducer TonB [Acidobacteria bacterium]|nr:energy transducer TonB [Acidobacteriota bacterium]